MGGRSGSFRSRTKKLTAGSLPKLSGSDFYMERSKGLREKYLKSMDDFNKLPEKEQFYRSAYEFLRDSTYSNPITRVAYHQWSKEHPDRENDIKMQDKLDRISGNDVQRGGNPAGRKKAVNFVKKYFDKGMRNITDARTWGREFYTENNEFFDRNKPDNRYNSTYRPKSSYK